MTSQKLSGASGNSIAAAANMHSQLCHPVESEREELGSS
jgi:hypothetical protein